MYAKAKIMQHSATGLRVSERAFFIKYDYVRPKHKPMRIDMTPRRKKSNEIRPTAFALNDCSSLPLAKSLIVLNRMIDTASLTIPSPKTKLNSLGVFLGFSMETAAITSVEHRREHISRISVNVKLTLVVVLQNSENI